MIKLGRNKLYLLLCLAFVSQCVLAEQVKDDDGFIETEEIDSEAVQEEAASPKATIEEDEDEVTYATPKPPPGAYLAETFDDIPAFGKTWIKSQTKKDGVDADIAKYDGVWSVEEPVAPLLKGDRGLVLKSKAKHAAISAPLFRPFKFGAKPFVVQYEVTLQEGQECGGAYIKLLSVVEGKPAKLTQFNDKTPYTIMFGPDKCGNEHKLHFIFRHVNPLNGTIEEKHAKRSSDKIEEPFKDKKPHLYTLVLEPDNTYQISLDHSIINSGHLLEDFTPAVNPEKEIADPNDMKPSDWDEREKIPDPDDKKPEDWDDDAPKKIPDASASMPSGWLEDQPEMIPDPEAVKPDDWDNDMDGEWEAPLINNPECSGAAGCGPWSRPMIDNPAYKGKWFARQISNPNYRGQWTPRMIPNPDYFEDLEPFKMTPISAVGFELWSMSDNILFDNVLITDSPAEARQFAADTFDLKVTKMDRGKGNYFQQFLEFSNQRPWIYAIYVLLSAIPVVIIVMCCCTSSAEKLSEEAEKKKTDAPTADDPEEKEGESEGAEETEGDTEDGSQEEEEDEEGGEEETQQDEEEQEEPKSEEKETKSSSRLRRKARKD